MPNMLNISEHQRHYVRKHLCTQTLCKCQSNSIITAVRISWDLVTQGVTASNINTGCCAIL